MGCSTRLLDTYTNMKQRCYNKNAKSFTDYGGRGIKVCDEWFNDFQAFKEWALSNGYNDTLTIDRIDNNKGYSPNNCRWVDRKTQNRNRKNVKYYTINGDTHCLSEWCEILGLNYNRVYGRINICKWSIKKALELEE